MSLTGRFKFQWIELISTHEATQEIVWLRIFYSFAFRLTNLP